MQLQSIRIQNLRGVKDATLEFDQKLTILVGANNSGKTTVLDAIAAILTFRRGTLSFAETDFRAEQTGIDVREIEPIIITIRIEPSNGTQFAPEEVGKVQPAVDEGSGLEHFRFRLRAGYSGELNDLEETLFQLNPEGRQIESEDGGFSSFPLRDKILFRAFGEDRKGTVALLRAIAGATLISLVKAGERWIREYPQIVFARCIFITEGFECLTLPHFARALGIDLHHLGIEIVNAEGQDNLLGKWRQFGKKGLRLPIVCLADSDVRDPLEKFLEAAGEGSIPTGGNLSALLRRHDYFCCPQPGQNFEIEIVEAIGSAIFDQIYEVSFEGWYAKSKDDKLRGTWKKKGPKVENLNSLEARACRLSRSKSDGPDRVAKLMTKDGTDATLIPERFKAALERARDLAGG